MLMGGAVYCFMISLPCFGRGRLLSCETPHLQHPVGIVAVDVRGSGAVGDTQHMGEAVMGLLR